MELDETVRSKDHLEKASYAMMDEIRALKSKLENQASDFTTVAIDLRNKSRKLEEDTRHVVSQCACAASFTRLCIRCCGVCV